MPRRNTIPILIDALIKKAEADIGFTLSEEDRSRLIIYCTDFISTLVPNYVRSRKEHPDVVACFVDVKRSIVNTWVSLSDFDQRLQSFYSKR